MEAVQGLSRSVGHRIGEWPQENIRLDITFSDPEAEEFGRAG